MTWEQARALSDAEVEAKLFTYVGRAEPDVRAAIDFDWVHRELRRVGVTLQLLWGEYVQAAQHVAGHPYQYSQFCELYASWRKERRLSMRQVHRAGEKVFIDYSGKKPQIVDADTGEVRDVELFVAVLGASNYTFAEVTLTQTVRDFVSSSVRALEYFGAAPRIAVPDQLRSAVKVPDRYDPDINPTFLEFAQHYGMAVIPAPPRKPKAKAKVEVGVLIVQRWILARLRHRRFFSLAELNWPPERMLRWAGKFGPHVEEVVRRTMARYPHPEMGYRPVLGILRCAEEHGRERMDAACHRALSAAGHSVPHRRFIEGILKRGLEREPIAPPPSASRSVAHENVRGGSYFDQENNHEHRRNHPEAHRHEDAHPSEGSEGDTGTPSRQTTLF